MWSILKHRSNQFTVSKENIDSQKYASILGNSINKIKEMLPKNGHCNEIMIVNIN